MRNKFLVGALIATAFCVSAEENPVLMTINGKDVKLSEFEYMYHKNSKQQLEKETLNDYVNRFVEYKLKVADAEAEGLDTLKTFVSEFTGHKNSLMRPYLDDNRQAEVYAKEAYERMKKNLEVSHIMMYGGEANKAKLDSIHECLKNGEDFGTLAAKYSVDQVTAPKNGSLGNLWVGRFPYAFENAAYNTPVGSFSDVIETQFGYHIIKVTGEHPTTGTYHVAHILKLYPRVGTDKSKDSVNAKMDSVYRVLKGGADFAAVAKTESDDTRTGRNGGEIGWFGIDQLVPAINNAMLETPVGSVSAPIMTEYGVHLIKVLEHKPLESYDEVKAKLIKTVNNDDRALVIKQNKIKDLKAEYNYKVDPKFESTLKEMLAENGYDSTFVDKLEKMDMVVFTYKGGSAKTPALMKYLGKKLTFDAQRGLGYVRNAIENVAEKELLAYEKEDLVNKYPDYANLLNEYRDGILMFEISNRKVWEKAANDTEGLENYFNQNKARYCTWTSPKFKGLIVYSVNDSVENAVKEFAKTLSGDSIATTLHKKFRREIKIEKHLTAKEDNNAIVNEFVFNGPKATRDQKYPTCFVLEGKVIEQPEEAADVKGQVTTDYQNQLEKEWVKELKSKYKVKINKKVLKLVKE